MIKAQVVRRVIAPLSAIVLATAAMSGIPSSASASASGCSWFGNIGDVGGLPVFNGSYCVQIDGHSTWVDGVSGNFSSFGNICNWNITAEFFDSAGRWYQTKTGPTHWSCTKVGSDGIYVNEWKQAGSMCSTLKQNGARITSVCHAIKP